jgi:4-amino-4-deoxy-L-arabinose transferase-like glycosyltransferase
LSRRTRGILLASCIVAVFLLLRLLNFNHVLMWDEGRFMATLRALSTSDKASPFWQYTRYHPPLYLAACLPAYKLSSSSGLVAAFSKVVSLLSSLGVMGLLYLVGLELEGRRTGILAAIAFALLPAAAVLNVWIKEDSLCLLFALLSIYLYLRGKPWFCGASLGLALLTKEIAVSTGLTLALFALLSVRKETWKHTASDLVKVYGMSLLISGWWYLLISNSVGYFWQFFTGTSYESQSFHEGWTYFLTGLWDDMGGILALMAAAGVIVMATRFLRGKDGKSLRPLAWTLATFTPCFFSYGKPYWLISMALPALALTAAVGMEACMKGLSRFSSPKIARFALVLLLLASFAIPICVGNAGYILSKGRHVPSGLTDYSFSVLSRDSADYFNRVWRTGDRLLGAFELANMPNPVFLYYFEHPDDLLLADGELELPEQVVRDRPAWTFIADTEAGRVLRDEMADCFTIEPEWTGIGYAYPTYLLFEEQQR